MTLDEERMRASEARRGAAMLRRHKWARAWDRDTLAAAVRMAEPMTRTARLPEAAFDWPVYRAAMVEPVLRVFDSDADLRRAGRK